MTYGAKPSADLIKYMRDVKSIQTEHGEKIPKLIHYCWFGKSSLPESAQMCISSWRKFFPDFKIVEWNEDNFDVNDIPYIKEAYERGKYAFVSDYARFVVLYLYGGVYFDTDVEVVKDMTPILSKGSFMGCEKDAGATDDAVLSVAPGLGLGVNPGLGLGVNPGLGLGVNPGLGLYKQLIDSYQNEHFINQDGTNNLTTIVDRTTKALCEKGLKNSEGIQLVAGIYIYPKDFFCPKIMDSDEINITENTYSIHHYDASWADELDKKSGRRAYRLKKVFGDRVGSAINVILYGWEKYGVIGSIKRIWCKAK